MAKYTQTLNKYTQKYVKDNYDEIKVRVPKGKKDEYKAQAEEKGMSLNAYIIHLLDGDK